jgi:hypothetical protein
MRGAGHRDQGDWIRDMKFGIWSILGGRLEARLEARLGGRLGGLVDEITGMMIIIIEEIRLGSNRKRVGGPQV